MRCIIYFVYVSEIPYNDEGGASRSVRALFKELVRQGHKCLSICRTPGERHTSLDGVTCLRTEVPEAWLSNILRHDKPNPKVILTQHVHNLWVLDAAAEHGVATILRVPSWEHFCDDITQFPECGWKCKEKKCAHRQHYEPMYEKATAIMSISQYVAKAVKEFYGRDSTVIMPSVEREQYLLSQRDRKYVTMVRGHSAKGAEFFLELAKQLPEVPFAIAGVCDPNIAQLMGQVTNVKHFPQRADIRDVYAQTGIYLAPVIWAEPFGRTLVETMMNGIPVVGSDRGAIPEILAGAGIVLPLVADRWIQVIKKLQQDQPFYSLTSKKCANRALSPEFDISYQVSQFVTLAESLIPATVAIPKVTPLPPRPEAKKVPILATAKVAFFGPWIGEFGWEIMSWQSWCRKEAKKYEKVYVCSFPNSEFLYKDFAEFIPHSGGIRELWGPTPRNIDFSKVSYTVPKDVDVQIKPIWALDSKGDFIRFGKEPNSKFSCLIHARGIKTHGQVFKNYPIELWEKVAQGLPVDTACIGTMDDLHIKGTIDLRGIPLEETANYLAGSRVIVGGSSGLMHFACLCGTPIIVWGPRLASGESLGDRYKKVWNPFHTRVEYITSDDWRPNPRQVTDLVDQVLTAHMKPVGVIEKELGHSLNLIVETTGGYIRDEELNVLYTTADSLSPKVLVEIGACTGTSSTILGAVAKKHKGMLYSIEPNPQPTWPGNMSRFGVSAFTKLIKASSPNVNPATLPFKVIDFLLIDGDHRYEAALADYRFWAPLVRVGGRIAFHDYRSQLGVQRAVSEILSTEDNKLSPLAETAGTIIKDGKPFELGLIVFEKVRE